MSEEEIRLLALELGLDPKRLIIFEPHDFEWKTRRFRFEYCTANGNRWDWNFLISRNEILSGIESEIIRFRVNEGLRELAKKINGQAAA
jgi:hypothetical protein